MQRRYAYSQHGGPALERNFQILRNRVPKWMNLFQENILPLRGMDTTLFQLALVYDWGPNGNIGQYIASHPNAHRPTLVRKARHVETP